MCLRNLNVCLPRSQVYKGVRRRVQEVAVKRLMPGTCHDEWLRRLQAGLHTLEHSTEPEKPQLRRRRTTRCICDTRLHAHVSTMRTGSILCMLPKFMCLWGWTIRSGAAVGGSAHHGARQLWPQHCAVLRGVLERGCTTSGHGVYGGTLFLIAVPNIGCTTPSTEPVLQWSHSNWREHHMHCVDNLAHKATCTSLVCRVATWSRRWSTMRWGSLSGAARARPWRWTSRAACTSCTPATSSTGAWVRRSYCAASPRLIAPPATVLLQRWQLRESLHWLAEASWSPRPAVLYALSNRGMPTPARAMPFPGCLHCPTLTSILFRNSPETSPNPAPEPLLCVARQGPEDQQRAADQGAPGQNQRRGPGVHPQRLRQHLRVRAGDLLVRRPRGRPRRQVHQGGARRIHNDSGSLVVSCAGQDDLSHDTFRREVCEKCRATYIRPDGPFHPNHVQSEDHRSRGRGEACRSALPWLRPPDWRWDIHAHRSMSIPSASSCGSWSPRSRPCEGSCATCSSPPSAPR